jgi:hypothetical protein
MGQPFIDIFFTGEYDGDGECTPIITFNREDVYPLKNISLKILGYIYQIKLIKF